MVELMNRSSDILPDPQILDPQIHSTAALTAQHYQVGISRASFGEKTVGHTRKRKICSHGILRVQNRV